MSQSKKVARHIKPANIAIGDIIRVTTKQADVRRSIVGCVAEIHAQDAYRTIRHTFITRLGVQLLAYYDDIGPHNIVVTLLGYNADFRVPDLELDLYPENDYVRP